MNNIFRLTIDITNYCNFDCIYCTLDIPYHTNRIKKDISIKDIKIIVLYTNKFLPDYNIDVCIRGGEPFLNKNIDIILREIKKIKNLNNIYILTNGSILLNKFNIDYHSIKEFRISIHVDTLLRISTYYDIIKNNIIYLLNKKYTPYVHIMNCNRLEYFYITKVYEQIETIYKKYFANIDNIEITETFSTKNYINNDYDYSKVNSIYNQKYHLPVFHNRAIKITPDMTYHYSCELAKSIIDNNNLYIPNVWKEIRNNTNNTVICQLETCVCPIFCFKE